MSIESCPDIAVTIYGSNPSHRVGGNARSWGSCKNFAHIRRLNHVESKRKIRSSPFHGSEKAKRSTRNAKFQAFFGVVVNHGVLLTLKGGQVGYFLFRLGCSRCGYIGDHHSPTLGGSAACAASWNYTGVGRAVDGRMDEEEIRAARLDGWIVWEVGKRVTED